MIENNTQQGKIPLKMSRKSNYNVVAFVLGAISLCENKLLFHAQYCHEVHSKEFLYNSSMHKWPISFTSLRGASKDCLKMYILKLRSCQARNDSRAYMSATSISGWYFSSLKKKKRFFFFLKNFISFEFYTNQGVSITCFNTPILSWYRSDTVVSLHHDKAKYSFLCTREIVKDIEHAMCGIWQMKKNVN